MSNLMMVTPLRIERAFVRRGVDMPVQRTGMGARRATRAAARLSGDGPLALLGVAGGVAPQVQVGDVVVASEVRGDDVTVSCPTATLLAGALRRAGLRVHVGPIATRPGLTRSAEIAALAAGGVLAVDMETAPVASAARGRPFAVVRVVSDTVAAPLCSIRRANMLHACATEATLAVGPQPAADLSSSARSRTSSTVISANGLERPPPKTGSARTRSASGFARAVTAGRARPRPRRACTSRRTPAS